MKVFTPWSALERASTRGDRYWQDWGAPVASLVFGPGSDEGNEKTKKSQLATERGRRERYWLQMLDRGQ